MTLELDGGGSLAQTGAAFWKQGHSRVVGEIQVLKTQVNYFQAQIKWVCPLGSYGLVIVTKSRLNCQTQKATKVLRCKHSNFCMFCLHLERTQVADCYLPKTPHICRWLAKIKDRTNCGNGIEVGGIWGFHLNVCA